MTEHPNRDEREALIVGDRAGSLAVHQAAEVKLLADLLALPSTWAEPNPALEAAIVRAVDDAQPAALPSRTPRAARVRHHRSRRRRVMVAALGAAAAVIAVVSVVVGVSGGGASTDYAARLSATALAPRASASAAISKSGAGFRVTLDAQNLPHLPDGEYYAAWLRSHAGVVVPIGTFSSSDGRVTLWSGVSPRTFRTITVTVQPAGSAEPASGRRVLIGRVHER